MKQRYDSTVEEMYFRDEFLTTDTDKVLKVDIQNLENTLKKMRRENRRKKDIDEYIETSIYEIQAKHWRVNSANREKAEQEMEKLADKWRRENDHDAARSLLQRQRFEAKYRLMSDDELSVEAQNYISAEGEDLARSPDDLTALALEISQRPGDQLESVGSMLRDTMKENRYDQPWLYSEAGDKLDGVIKAHSTEYGQTLVSIDGGGSLTPINIESLINEEVRDD